MYYASSMYTFCRRYGHSCFKCGHYNLRGIACEKDTSEAAKYYEMASNFINALSLTVCLILCRNIENVPVK